MNDSLRTDVFVRYPPETIAVACIYLSARKLKEPLPKNPSWFEVLGKYFDFFLSMVPEISREKNGVFTF